MLVVVHGKPPSTTLVNEDATFRAYRTRVRLSPPPLTSTNKNMTVDELTNKIEHLRGHCKNLGEYNVTIHKQDKNQLSCHTTVPVERIDMGFDWTTNQLILEPSIKLTTHPDETHDNLVQMLVEHSKDKTRHLMLAAQLARIVENEVNDEDLKGRMRDILRQF